MAYDHKKSLRTLTDEQFSDGTTVDGSRLDNALDESVEHFNSIPEGDVSTRFTKTQYIFGYQPAPYTGTPNNSSGNVSFEALRGTVEGSLLPWNFITNNDNTAAEVSGAPPTYGNKMTPTAGFQNKWRIKGTNYHSQAGVTGGAIEPVTNSGQWADAAWESAWTDTASGAVAARNVVKTYQFSWSHSWIFPSPVILDSICLFLRTDDPVTAGVGGFGYYDAPFWFVDQLGNANWTNCVSAHVSIDNEFAKEERDQNAVEFVFQDRWLDGYDVSPFMKGNSGSAYVDMLPNAPDYSGGTGAGLQGKLVRFRDLNIPVRKGARLRMSIVVPWFRSFFETTATSNQGFSQGLNTGNQQHKFVLWDSTSAPPGTEPVYNFSLNGCMNVLEPVGY